MASITVRFRSASFGGQVMSVFVLYRIPDYNCVKPTFGTSTQSTVELPKYLSKFLDYNTLPMAGAFCAGACGSRAKRARQ